MTSSPPGGRTASVVPLFVAELTTSASSAYAVPLTNDGSQNKTVIGNLDGVSMLVRGYTSTTAIDPVTLATMAADGAVEIPGVYHSIDVILTSTPGTSGAYVDLMF